MNCGPSTSVTPPCPMIFGASARPLLLPALCTKVERASPSVPSSRSQLHGLYFASMSTP
jgi:hypothetical protein